MSVISERAKTKKKKKNERAVHAEAKRSIGPEPGYQRAKRGECNCFNSSGPFARSWRGEGRGEGEGKEPGL